MRKHCYVVAAIALGAVTIGEMPGQAQKQIRPQTPRGFVWPPPHPNRLALERRLTQLTLRKREAMQEFTPNSPEVRALEREIRKTRLQLQREPKGPRPNFWRPELQWVSSR